jgi:hypothetical protein
MCGKVNPPDLDVCQYCGARLKPVLPPSSDDSEPIHPGEAPTPKNTAELERALPSWLRSLRGGKDSIEADSGNAAPSGENLSIETPAPPASESTGELPDWLAGLDKPSTENEEVPDWLAGLRPEKTGESATNQESEVESTPELGNSDWMSRLDAGSQAATSAAPAEEKASFEEPASPLSDDQTPDWLKSFQSTESKSPEPPAPPSGGEKIPDWFSGLPGISAENGPESSPPISGMEEPASAGNLPEWLNQIPEKTAEPESTPPATAAGEPASREKLPDWLNQLQEKNAEAGLTPSISTGGETPSMDNLPDWLNQLQGKTADSEFASTADQNESVPNWLSGVEPEAGAPIPASAGNVPDWLSNLESKPVSESETSANAPGSEPPSGATPPGDTPSWLTQLQADIHAAEEVEKHKDDYEVVSEPASQMKGNEPLPEWLSGIERTAPPTSGPPALIIDKGNPPDVTGESAFSMEAPDWLSKLKPEQGAEKSAPSEGDQPPAADIEAAALPSWVQAMRPVESVVDEAKANTYSEEQVTEQSGPLAGLIGVLPSGPGLGALRKPPAYSVKLQISDTQQRYISNLESLVASETQNRTVKASRLTSNRLWRWLITVLLVLAVGFPFVIPQIRLTPPPTLLSSDKGATSALIEAIPTNAPVLIAFEYDPALSGELEAVAAPFVDQLQAKGARLAMVSTSPTGTALAERFLKNALLVNSHQYKSGEQYANLGYLAGGPTGISLFASAPSVAMPFTANGGPVWLQGVTQLSDFAAVIILTDNADTGRNWIEQSGRYLGKTPMIMVISAQAEPMVRPYFDSGQLKGLVSGIVDAKTYEQSYNRPGLADHYWDSYSIGTLAAELIIAIGAIWSAFSAWRARRSGSREEV